MIPTANIAVSVVCLILALIFFFSQIWPKVQIILLLLAGAGMGAGVIGGGIRDGIARALSWTDDGMLWAFGAPVPGLLACVVTALVFMGWKGKLTWLKKAKDYTLLVCAFAAPLVWHMTGGIFGGLAFAVGSIGGVLGNVIFLPITGF